jgi:hypothetical protein
MDKVAFTAIISQIDNLCTNYVAKGYAYKTKSGIQSQNDNEHIYVAVLKQGNVSVQITANSNGFYKLARLNSFTHATHQLYDSTSIFSIDDLNAAIAYEFPFPKDV